MDLENFIQKVLLDNAGKYDGVSDPKAALGAVMREFPEYRGKSKEILPLANKLSEEINALSVDEQNKLLQNLGGADAPEKEERNPFELNHPNPILRFEPSPSGPLHIGHAFTLGLNHLLAERNNGKLILRIADTNPENIYPDAYNLIPEDVKWFTHDNFEGPFIQSDRMDLYYMYAEKVLSQNNAYVCTCESEAFKVLVNNKQPCPCRELPPAINLERWELMRTTLQPGEAVVRMKTDITHKNPAMRDWPALRINTSAHPRQDNKYRVWPLMNFSVSVDDMEMGVTHVLRAKDHADNARRQSQFYKMFHHDEPEVFNVGRINFTDLRLSTSQTRILVQEGEYSGWEDIRLPFLGALRRRGFTPEALLKHADSVGISPADKTLSKDEYFTQIEAFNKDFIDSTSDRYFFVQNPQEIKIIGAPKVTIEKDLHPSLRIGGRSLTVSDTVFVNPEDLENPEGVLFRLMDAFNFKYDSGSWQYVSSDVEDYRNAPKKRIIHYLPTDHECVDAYLNFPDGSIVKGLFETDSLTTGDMVQLERIGFAKVDSTSPLTFWFAHR